MIKTHKINEIEFTTCVVPDALIPSEFNGIVLIVPTDYDQDRLQSTRKIIDDVSCSIGMVATWINDLNGWVIQQKSRHE